MEQATQLVGRLFGFRWSKELGNGFGGIDRVGGLGAGRCGHSVVSSMYCGHFVKLFT
jgi:hypothetical protein